MEATAESVFETDKAPIIYRTLLPEIETTVTERSDIHVEAFEDRLVLKVIAADLVSLRSTMNTWLRLIQVAYEVLEQTNRELRSN